MISPVVLGAGINALGSLFNVFGQRDANKTNLQAVRETNAQNMQIYKDQLEYNKPIQQMSRLKEAGLNPMLMYGQGNVGNASSLPQMQAPKVNPVQFDSSQLSQFPMMQAQLKVANAQSDSLQATAQKTQQDTKRIEIENLYRAKEHELDIINKGIKAGFSQQQIKQSQAQVRLLDQQINKLTIQNKYEDERQTLDLESKKKAIQNWKNVIANTALMPEHTRKLIEGLSLKNIGQEYDNRWKYMTKDDRHQLILWTIEALAKKRGLTQAQVDKLEAETDFTKTKSFWYTFNAIWNKVFGLMGRL